MNSHKRQQQQQLICWEPLVPSLNRQLLGNCHSLFYHKKGPGRNGKPMTLLGPTTELKVRGKLKPQNVADTPESRNTG